MSITLGNYGSALAISLDRVPNSDKTNQQRHSFHKENTADLTDGCFLADPVGHSHFQHSPGSVICGGKHRLVWTRF